MQLTWLNNNKKKIEVVNKSNYRNSHFISADLEN